LFAQNYFLKNLFSTYFCSNVLNFALNKRSFDSYF
jgi:hypothetical protein